MTAGLQLVRRGLTAEFLKHRNTFMLWFVLSAPLIVTGITFLTLLADDRLSVVDAWRGYISFNFRPYFHIFVFLQILLVSHVHYIEHRNNTWKNLRVLPIPFGTIFLSKALFVCLVLTANVLLFYFLIMLSGYLLGIARPELGFQHNDYWFEAFVPSIKFLTASSSVTAIMFWVSYHFRSILVSIVLGFTGYASGFALYLVTSRQGYTGFPYSKWHPFNFSGYAFGSFGTGNHSITMEYVYAGLAGGILILLLHYISCRNRNVL